MSTQWIRDITIHCNDLGQQATLLLTFDSEKMEGLYRDVYPTAWRVSTFPASGPYSLNAVYRNQLTFIKPQVAGNVIVNAATWRDIGEGQKTNLNSSGDFYSFTDPVPGSPGLIQAFNKTNAIEGIGLGFNDGRGSGPPPTVLYFDKVAVDYYVAAQFTPVLTAYVVTGYQKNQILRGAIQSPPIWQEDLSAISQYSSYTLTYDKRTGKFNLLPDNSALEVVPASITGYGIHDEELSRLLQLLKDLKGNSSIQRLLENVA